MVEHRIDPKRRRAYIVLRGDIDAETVMGGVAELFVHPDFRPDFDQLCDFRDVTSADLHYESSQRIIHMPLPEGAAQPTGRLALVSERDYFFGLMRMYEMLGDHLPIEIRVFREIEAAEAWLDTPRRASTTTGPDDASS